MSTEQAITPAAHPGAPHLHALPAPEDGWKMLLTKEVLRFWRVATQTIAAPVLTSVLYLLIFGHVLQGRVQVYPGVGYVAFLVPGLVMMSVLQNAFANSASSLVQSKIMGNLVFLLLTPLNAWHWFIAYVGAAVLRLLLEPVGPRAPAVLGVEGRALLLELLVDRLDFVAQGLAGLGIQQLLVRAALADHLDRRAAQAVGTLRGLDQPILAAAGLLQRLPTCRGQGLLLGLVPGVQLDGVHAQADRVFLVLPLRFGSCLPFGRSLERAKPRLQLRLGKVAG